MLVPQGGRGTAGAQEHRDHMARRGIGVAARRGAQGLPGRASWRGSHTGQRRHGADVRRYASAAAGAVAVLLSLALTGADPIAWAGPTASGPMASGPTGDALTTARTPRSPAQAAAVDTARRAQHAAAYFTARRADAEAVAAAARDAVAACLVLDPTTVPADLRSRADATTAALDALTTTPTPGTHAGDLSAATIAIETAAADLFRLAEQVRVAAAGPAPTDAVRWSAPGSLARLETLASAAAAQAALDLPLVPTVVDAPGPADLCTIGFAAPARLRCDAAEALEQLAEAFRADTGQELRVTSAFRTFAEQTAVKAARGPLAAAPGTSRHELGVAVDLAGMGALGDFTTPAYLWMAEHAAVFGWHHPRAMEPGGRGPLEPWHWEFGGRAPPSAS